METQLIELYLLICDLYDKQTVLKHQRLSNFKPSFTDQELLTMYLFGHLQGLTTQRRIYNYFAAHWREWFPALPTYQAFNRRLHQLTPAFELLIEDNLRAAGIAPARPPVDAKDCPRVDRATRRSRSGRTAPRGPDASRGSRSATDWRPDR